MIYPLRSTLETDISCSINLPISRGPALLESLQMLRVKRSFPSGGEILELPGSLNTPKLGT